MDSSSFPFSPSECVLVPPLSVSPSAPLFPSFGLDDLELPLADAVNAVVGLSDEVQKDLFSSDATTTEFNLNPVPSTQANASSCNVPQTQPQPQSHPAPQPQSPPTGVSTSEASQKSSVEENILEISSTGTFRLFNLLLPCYKYRYLPSASDFAATFTVQWPEDPPEVLRHVPVASRSPPLPPRTRSSVSSYSAQHPLASPILDESGGDPYPVHLLPASFFKSASLMGRFPLNLRHKLNYQLEKDGKTPGGGGGISQQMGPGVEEMEAFAHLSHTQSLAKIPVGRNIIINFHYFMIQPLFMGQRCDFRVPPTLPDPSLVLSRKQPEPPHQKPIFQHRPVTAGK